MAAVDKAADVATLVVGDVKDRVTSKSSLSGVKSFVSGWDCICQEGVDLIS